MRKTIKGALTYPGFLILLGISVMSFYGLKVIPQFSESLPRERWEGSAANMGYLTDFVNYYLVPSIIVMAVVVAVVFYSLPRFVGPVRARLDQYPPWSLYRLSLGAGFMLSVSALLKAGVKVPTILEILRRNANPWYEERMSATLRHVANGTNLGDALYRTKLGFPDLETARDLRGFASLDGFEDILETIARKWIGESVGKVKVQAAILKNLAFLFIGALFAFLFTGLFALQQQIAAAAM